MSNVDGRKGEGELMSLVDHSQSAGLSRRAWLAGVVSAGVAYMAVPSWTLASSGRSSRDEASRAIPWNKLSATDRKRVADVVNDTSVFRRMPEQSIECDPTLYLFLVDHPEVVVDIWRVLGISQMTFEKTSAQSYRSDDGAGTVGDVQFLVRSHDTHLLYGEGYYEGPLFNRRVRGKCVLLLKSAYVRETDGRYYVTARMDAFVQLENLGADLIARTFQPLMGPVADHNFRETANFLGSLNTAAARSPGGLHSLGDQLSNVDAKTRETFVRLTDELALRAAENEEAQIASRRTQTR